MFDQVFPPDEKYLLVVQILVIFPPVSCSFREGIHAWKY